MTNYRINNVNRVKNKVNKVPRQQLSPCIDWSAWDLCSPICIRSRSHRIVIFTSTCCKIEQVKSISFAMFDEISGLITVNSVNKVKNKINQVPRPLWVRWIPTVWYAFGLHFDSKRFPSLCIVVRTSPCVSTVSHHCGRQDHESMTPTAKIDGPSLGQLQFMKTTDPSHRKRGVIGLKLNSHNPSRNHFGFTLNRSGTQLPVCCHIEDARSKFFRPVPALITRQETTSEIVRQCQMIDRLRQLCSKGVL